MSVPEEIIKKGIVTIYNDTPPALVRDIDAYNKRAVELRVGMKHVRELRFGYKIFSALTVFSLCFAKPETVFERPVLAVCFLCIYAVLFVLFACVKNEFFLSTAAAALLLPLDLTFAILLAADAVLYVLHERIHWPLKQEPGYPEFFPIHTHYEDTNTPTEDLRDGEA